RTRGSSRRRAFATSRPCPRAWTRAPTCKACLYALGSVAMPNKPTGDLMGDRIRQRRMELGMSLAQVAGGDFSRAFLNQVELGKTQPSTRILRVVADRLGAPVEYLLDGSMPMLD